MSAADDIYPSDIPVGGQDMLADQDPSQDMLMDGQDMDTEPLPAMLTIEEIAERRKLINWLAIGKADFTDVYNSLGVTDDLVASYDVERLKLLKGEFQKVRDFRNSYTTFLDLAKRTSYMAEMLMCGMGIDMTGLHNRLASNPKYSDALKAVVHDHCQTTVSPVAQLTMIILYTAGETYSANMGKKVIGAASADDTLVDSLDL